MRLEDIAAQKRYAAMLDQQEKDRANEIAAREKRAQDFMNRMADGVLKEMDNMQKKEDEMIAKYERQRELKLRQQEEDKAKKKAKEQKFILQTLDKQREFREQQKKAEKDDLNKQGEMWAKEREIWQAEEKRI